MKFLNFFILYNLIILTNLNDCFVTSTSTNFFKKKLSDLSKNISSRLQKFTSKHPLNTNNDQDIRTETNDNNYPTNNNINNNECICVPFYQCSNGKIVDDGSGIIEPRKIKPSKHDVPLNEGYIPPYCGSYHICCSEPDSQTQRPYISRCGIRNPNGINSAILKPEKVDQAEFGEWPWQAIILAITEKGREFICSGALLDERYVITVAHCINEYVKNKNIHLLRIRLGDWNVLNDNEFILHEDIAIESIVIHPNFNSNNLHNDIALINLANSVKMKPNIDKICLPNYDEQHFNQECIVTGWGKRSHISGYSSILKEINMRMIPHGICQNLLRETRLGTRFRLFDGFVCAGGEKEIDSCKGDGGGPLVCYREDGTYALMGLVSWGIGCGQENVPGVYTNILKYLDWIIDVTGKQLYEYQPMN